MTVIANNGASVQMILPNFMRARGMAVHQMVFFGAMVVGSLLWGKIADLWSVQTALIVFVARAGAAHRARRVDPAAGLVDAARLSGNLRALHVLSAPQEPQKFCRRGRIRL